MILRLLKTYFSMASLLIISPFVHAQSNYFKYSAGFGGGPNKSYTDVYKSGSAYTAYGTLDFYLTPFISLGIEAQYGQIKGGDIYTDPNNRQFTNQYSGLTFNGKVMLGELVDYDRSEFLYNMRGFYFGLGVGIVNNNITDIVRQRPSFSDNPGYTFPGVDKSINLQIPFNVGFNYFIMDGYGYQRYVINVNAQANYTFGEGLDGYNDASTKFKNYSPDIFNAYTIGFKYLFGTIRAYRKTL